MATLVTGPLRRLAGAMAELRDRVREALAGEVGRAVGEAVREVVAAALRGGATTAPVPAAGRPPPARDDWADPWDDRPDWARDEFNEYDDRDHGAHGATARSRDPDRHPTAPPPAGPTAGAPAAPAAVAAGLTAGRWWLRRRGSVAEAVGVGVLVALAVLAGGPAARAGAAVVTAAGDMLAATEALGTGAARLNDI